MARTIFINLPVADVARATAFYAAVGATQDMRFSNDRASMMAFSDTIAVMLLAHDFFATFTTRPIADARNTAGMLLCLSADSRADVDAMVERAGGAGGATDPCPRQDHGAMYGRSFEDPDGHIWETMWMDVAAMTGAPAEAVDA